LICRVPSTHERSIMNYTERAAGGEHPRHGGISLGCRVWCAGARRTVQKVVQVLLWGGHLQWHKKNPQALAALGKAVRVGLGSAKSSSPSRFTLPTSLLAGSPSHSGCSKRGRGKWRQMRGNVFIFGCRRKPETQYRAQRHRDTSGRGTEEERRAYTRDLITAENSVGQK